MAEMNSLDVDTTENVQDHARDAVEDVVALASLINTTHPEKASMDSVTSTPSACVALHLAVLACLAHPIVDLHLHLDHLASNTMGRPLTKTDRILTTMTTTAAAHPAAPTTSTSANSSPT